MKTITNDYKTQIKTFGRQIDAKISYTISNTTYELGAEDLNSISLHYEGNLLKSVMKQLDIDSNMEIPIGTILEYQFAVKVNGLYEYISFGNFIVYSSEKQEDTGAYKIVCYDKMLNSMKDYETLGIAYPISIRSYINALCTKIGLTFANLNDTFPNYDQLIPSELYLDNNGNSLDYTFRDVLDELAQVTASTICINDDDELELRYINNTNDTIDEEFLKNVNVNFGEVYGPINTISFKRSADSDVISLSNPIDLSDDLKNEIAICDNQILNQNNRADYLEDILTQLYGLTYSINDFASTGITYYDLCDKYNVTIGNNTYTCIMFNDEINVTQGLEENIHTNMPDDSKTDYTKTTKDDRGLSRTNLIVDKVNQRISSLIGQNDDIRAIVLGDYTLTGDTTFQANKTYYILDDGNFEEYTNYNVGDDILQELSYTCDGTETGTYYFTYNGDDYYFTMPNVSDNDQLIFNVNTKVLTYNGTTISTSSSGSGTELTFEEVGWVYELTGSIVDRVDENNTNLQDQINNNANAIQTLNQSTTSQFTQTINSFEASFSTLTQAMNNNVIDTNQAFEDIKRYLRYSNDGVVELGVSTSDIVLRLVNNKISFYDTTSSNEVAYISNNKLYITDGEFLNRLVLGNFAFIPRSNGSLGFRKVS